MYTHIHTHIHSYINTYNEILFSHEKGENPAVCNNMDGPWENHTKENKPERNTTWYHLYVESKNSQTIEIEEKSMLSGAGRWEKQREDGKSVQVFKYKMHKVWGSNV